MSRCQDVNVSRALSTLNTHFYDIISHTTSIHAHLKVDHTIYTPVRRPGVSYNPVARRGSVTIVTNELYAVILGKVGRGTGRCGKHTLSSVSRPLRSIHANRHGLHRRKSRCQPIFILIVTSEGSARVDGVGVASDAASRHRVRLASTSYLSHTRSVGVGALACHPTCTNHVIESLLGPASTTAVALSITRYDLLRRELGQSVAGQSPGRLNSLSGRESPARTTLTL